ncbi:MAG: glycosyltransferase family 4 protein [Rhodospirillaceae bacterium]|jgi:glycosyltransferase involved in cell wall biosynthesis|nr:glycosyltransferase family 4 protein [Rhodospirillaceae bacterium]MBT3495109.1 glycosyltransferase family 4 protein [Rhodospirillaceae bacterium]MBT3782535.1 glycosyltransferase family 4 protein [Rhodospirillaceae bacterium]MBT3977201.1 glycosyltransferase family 4 protein [Rhodospirillaceae bacterium]MBT4170822.1 glycosyltransferase family 4 protein [Rhodospirillaceae bacterium]
MDSTLQSSIQAAGAEAAQGTASQGPLVLQVLPAMDMGGVERGTVQTAAALTAAGWRAMVASSGGPMVHELSRAGAKHIEMPLAAKRPFRMLRNADALADLINREGVDLVHARSRAPAWSALSAARRTDKPFVTTFHNAYGHNWLKHHYNKVMAKGDKVIAISDFVAQHVRETYGVDDDRLVTIHRGINADIFDPANVSAERMIQLSKPWRLPDDRPVIMLPGRLTRWKGHSVLIEALAILGRKDICCVLVGGDQGRTAYRQKLEEQARRRGLDQVLRVVEHCSDMAAAYMLADVVVSASTHPEGFGRVAVEAQAMGRPVIATDHGGSRETIWHDESGWLVPPNEPEAMAAALERALSLNQAEREAMAANGRDNVEQNFTVTLMCQRILAVYQSLLG